MKPVQFESHMHLPLLKNVPAPVRYPDADPFKDPQLNRRKVSYHYGALERPLLKDSILEIL